MQKFLKIIGVTLFLAVSIFSLAFSEESFTITTYYPSPYGSYNEMQLYPHSAPVTACNNSTKGTMYYDSDDDQIKTCNGSSWQPVGGKSYTVVTTVATYSDTWANRMLLWNNAYPASSCGGFPTLVSTWTSFRQSTTAVRT